MDLSEIVQSVIEIEDLKARVDKLERIVAKLQGKREKQEAFVKPTLEEAREYCRERGLRRFDVDKWWHLLETKGWTYGKAGDLKPVQSWHGSIGTYKGYPDFQKPAETMSVQDMFK